MITTYKDILSLPNAAAFCVAAWVARYPMAVFGLATVILVRAEYESFTIAGVLTGLNVMAVAIGSPLIGRLVDRFGQRRVMLPAYLISSAAMLLMGISASLKAPIWLLFVFGIIGGATAGQTGALVRSRWSYICSEPKKLRTAFALESILDELCFATGPILTTVLCTLLFPAAGIVFAVSCSVIGGLWLLSQRVTEPPVNRPEDNAASIQNMVFTPPLIALSVMMIFVGMFLGQMNVSTVAFVDQIRSESWAGVLFSAFAMGSLIAGLFYGAQNFRASLARLFIITIFGFGLSGMALFFAFNFWLMFILMWCTGMFLAPSITNVNAMVQQTVSNMRLTEGLTWISTANCVGAAGGSALSGWLIDIAGIKGAYLGMSLTGAILLLAALVAYFVFKTYTDREKSFDSTGGR